MPRRFFSVIRHRSTANPLSTQQKCADFSGFVMQANHGGLLPQRDTSGHCGLTRLVTPHAKSQHGQPLIFCYLVESTTPPPSVACCGQMRYMALFDREGKFLFISGTVSDGGFSPAKVVGTYPWDWCTKPQGEYVRAQFDAIRNPGVTDHHYGLLWEDPAGGAESKYFWHHMLWIGAAEVAIAQHIWEFPKELGNLSPTERDTLAVLGVTQSAKGAAKHMGVTVNTVRSHIGNIREKLSLDDTNEVLVFASHYEQAINGDS